MLGYSENRILKLESSWGDDFVLKISITNPKRVYLRFINVGGVANYSIDWGNGYIQQITSYVSVVNRYYDVGEYYISISGSCPNFYFTSSIWNDRVELINWGNIGLISCENMFQMITDLVIPDMAIPNIENVNSFSRMFYRSNISYIPPNLLENAYAMTDASIMFALCQIAIIPEELLYNCTFLENANSMFADNNLMTINTDIFSNCKELVYIDYVFANNSSLISICSDLFCNCSKIETCYFSFSRCNLSSIPDLFDISTHPLISEFRQCFYNNINATGLAPDLWNRYNIGSYSSGCFGNCTLLSNYSLIPRNWK